MAAILVIERDREVRNLLLLQLRHLGHDPIDGGQCGEAPGAGRPCDLVLVEPAFPAAYLFASLLAEVRADIPLVFVSTESRTRETRRLRPAAHLLKPFSLAELGYAVDEALRNASSSAR